MKSFKQFVVEAQLPKAESAPDLLKSIKDGRFTKDGSHLRIDGDFYCPGMKLISLQGVPSFVGGMFNCDNNNLTSLQGGPITVGGSFYCRFNKLTSLEGAPINIGHEFIFFNCSNNKLSSLKGAPKIIGGDFYCDDNKLTSLQDIHKHINEIKGRASFEENEIKSRVLGLLKIKGLEKVALDNFDVQKIINKHLHEGDILDCVDVLEDAGYGEFAKL